MYTFQHMVQKQLDIHNQKWTLTHIISSCENINSKCILELNLKLKTIQTLEENMREKPLRLPS